MNLATKILLTILFSLQCLLCISQTDQWVNCLSHRQVNEIIELDNQIYAATTGGLIIYEPSSETITNLNRGNSDIPSNNIIDIKIDKDSTLWLMTDLGLCSYKDGIWIEYLDLSGIITLDENEYLMLASKANLFYWNGDNFDSLSTYPDLTILELQDLLVDKLNGDIWLSGSAAFAPSQLFKYADNSWTEINFNFMTYELFELAFDSDNNLWCITDRDLFKLENEWTIKTQLIEELDNYYFTSLGSDDEGNVYTSFNHPNKLNDNYIYKIDSQEGVHKYLIPRENTWERLTPTFIKTSIDNSTIYLGTLHSGCLSYENENWSVLPIETSAFKTNYMNVNNSESEGLFIKSAPYLNYGNHQFFNYKDNTWTDLSAVYPFKDAFQFRFEFSSGKDQELWINFNDSLYLKEGDNWTLASMPNISQDIVESNSQIYFDHEESRWLLNKEKNYILYESLSGWKIFNKDQFEIALTNYSSIFNHPVTDELWVSGYQGIAIYNYNNDEWRFLSFSELGIQSSFLDIKIGPNQDIITRKGQSIIRIIEGTEIDTIASLTGYPELGSFASMYMEQDTIWLGMTGGIAKFYDDNFEVMDRYNSGIVNGYINSIVRDDNGNLWCSSSSGGLAIYNENGLTEDFDNKFFTSNVENPEASLSFALYPNPFNSDLYIKLPEEIHSAKLNVYNQLGQLIYNKSSIIQNENIPLFNVPVGLYFVEIIDQKSNLRGIQKCIKQ